MLATSFRSKTRMPASARRAELRSELDTAPRKRFLYGVIASMKRSTVDPVPTPNTVSGVSSGKMNCTAASATCRLRSDCVSMRMILSSGKNCGVLLFRKTDTDLPVGVHHHRTSYQGRKLGDQRQPILGSLWRLALGR